MWSAWAHLDRCSWKVWREGGWYVKWRCLFFVIRKLWDVLPPPHIPVPHRSALQAKKPCWPWSFTTVEASEMLIRLIHWEWQFQIAHLRASRTHSRGQVGWCFMRVDLQSCVSKRNFTGKARWQCPRALCTDCRHAISWWSPDRKGRWTDPIWLLVISEHCIRVFMKVWTASKSFCSRRCAYVYAILGVEMGKDVRFRNILKHHETVPDASFIMTVLDCPQVHESSKSDKYEDTWGFSRNAASCWVFIWSDLECFSDLLNPGKSSIRWSHIRTPTGFHTSGLGWFQMSKNHPGHTDHQLWAIAHTTARHVVSSSVIAFFIFLLGMDLTLKLGLLSTWNTWTRCWLFFLVLHPWC